jgi:HEAT repeat protein
VDDAEDVPPVAQSLADYVPLVRERAAWALTRLRAQRAAPG